MCLRTLHLSHNPCIHMQITWLKNARKFKWSYLKTHSTQINECVGGHFGMPTPQTAMHICLHLHLVPRCRQRPEGWAPLCSAHQTPALHLGHLLLPSAHRKPKDVNVSVWVCSGTGTHKFQRMMLNAWASDLVVIQWGRTFLNRNYIYLYLWVHPYHYFVF